MYVKPIDMKIQIENYFGNDILTLVYNEMDMVINKGRTTVVGTIASTLGYDVADVDTDENGHQFIRVQEVNVANTDSEARRDLLQLIHKFNLQFL